jgi:hypothetical protein
MIIQFNTDHNIQGLESLEAKMNAIITDEMSRFSDQITRIEVFLSDENGHKKGKNDKKCILEARLEGMQPLAVSDHANNHEVAVKGALVKLKTVIETRLGQLKNY